MVLDNDEYSITGDNITINKYALEKWRDHYKSMVLEEETPDSIGVYYRGKSDAIVELLRHFEKK